MSINGVLFLEYGVEKNTSNYVKLTLDVRINRRIHTQQEEKGHARLKKQMEDEKKGKVHKIELYDAGHKKKDGTYVNNNVKIVMDKSHDELAKRKAMNNGNLSTQDFQVFDEVVAKKSKSRGYYDNKYWSQVKVSQGLTFVGQSEDEMTPSRVNKIKTKLENLCSKAETFPGADWRNRTTVEENDVDLAKRVDNNIQHGHGDDYHSSDDNHEKPSATGQYPTDSVQAVSDQNYNKDMEGCANSYLPCENTTAKQRQVMHMENCSQANKGYAGIALPREYVAKLKHGAQNKRVVQHS